MKRTILAGLTVLTLAIAAASPANALSPRFKDAQRIHNEVSGNVVATPGLSTDANLNQRFRDARTENLNNKLNPRFKEARTENLNNKLNPRFKEARTENLNNKLNDRFKQARDRNTYN
jgi:Spy/CpxP family protein refolding chaperone